jgi:hypothetical protein
VYVDLTAAYDTARSCVVCYVYVYVLVYRYFQVFLGDKNSRWRRLNNDIFNLYMLDIPRTTSKQRTFAECEGNLEMDLEILNRHFRRWLQPNLEINIPWFLVLANIDNPKFRLEIAAVRELVNCRRHARVSHGPFQKV